MENLLIITRDFTPYCARIGWMIRAVSMANFFSEKGFKVSVIATKRYRHLSTINTDNGIEAHWVANPLETFDDGQRSLKYSYMKALQKFAKLHYEIRKKPLLDHTEPALPAYRQEVFNLLRKKEIKYVIISAPPHSLLLLGADIKKHSPKTVIVADMRDAWSLRPIYLGSTQKVKRIERLEKEALEAADHVLFVSKGMKDLYCEKLNIKSPHIIENGFIHHQESLPPQKDFQQTIETYKAQGKLVIAYFGSGHLGFKRREKDLSAIFTAIEADSRLMNRIALVIQGNIILNKNFKSAVSFKIFESTNNTQSVANMQLIDVGLNMNTDREYAPIMMGGKLYEYISCKKPLFVIAHDNAISLKDIVEKTGGYFANIASVNEIQRVLFQLLEEHDSGLLKTKSDQQQFDLQQYSRESQYNKLLTILEKSNTKGAPLLKTLPL